MRRVNLSDVMNETNMAVITDEHNNFMYDKDNLCMYRGNKQDEILIVNMKMKLQASKENQEEAVENLITLMEALNVAFNRAVGAPESMKLFKVIDKNCRYAGNETVIAELKLATLATGAGSAIYTLLGYHGMSMNIWGTEANVFETTSSIAKETYGLGNALRSWKAVMKKYGKDFNASAVAAPAILVNYVQS